MPSACSSASSPPWTSSATCVPRTRSCERCAMVADTRSLPRLLIVDDDLELRELLRTRFEGLGMAVTVAGGAAEALAKLASVRCDVALFELGCGGPGSGLGLLARAREQQPEMEVILLTADSSVQT